MVSCSWCLLCVWLCGCGYVAVAVCTRCVFAQHTYTTPTMRVHAHSTTGKGSVGRLARRTSRHLALLTLYANSLFAMGHEAEAERLLTPLSQLDGFADLAQQVRGACTGAGSRVRVRVRW